MNIRPNIKLKAILFEKGITQRDLAYQTNIDETRMSKIIRGYEQPTYEMKEAIADFLKVGIEDLFKCAS